MIATTFPGAPFQLAHSASQYPGHTLKIPWPWPGPVVAKANERMATLEALTDGGSLSRPGPLRWEGPHEFEWSRPFERVGELTL